MYGAYTTTITSPDNKAFALPDHRICARPSKDYDRKTKFRSRSYKTTTRWDRKTDSGSRYFAADPETAP